MANVQLGTIEMSSSSVLKTPNMKFSLHNQKHKFPQIKSNSQKYLMHSFILMLLYKLQTQISIFKRKLISFNANVIYTTKIHNVHADI